MQSHNRTIETVTVSLEMYVKNFTSVEDQYTLGIDPPWDIKEFVKKEKKAAIKKYVITTYRGSYGTKDVYMIYDAINYFNEDKDIINFSHYFHTSSDIYTSRVISSEEEFTRRGRLKPDKLSVFLDHQLAYDMLDVFNLTINKILNRYRI